MDNYENLLILLIKVLIHPPKASAKEGNLPPELAEGRKKTGSMRIEYQLHRMKNIFQQSGNSVPLAAAKLRTLFIDLHLGLCDLISQKNNHGNL